MMHEILADHQMFHSFYQIDNFMIGQVYTDYGRYRQAVREVHGRMANLFTEFRKLAQTEHQSVWLSRRAAILDIIRELQRLMGIAVYYKDLVGELDQGRREELDAEHWVSEMKRRISLDYVSGGCISRESINDLLRMPEKDRKELWEFGVDKGGHERAIKFLTDLRDREDPEIQTIPFLEIVSYLLEYPLAKKVLPHVISNSAGELGESKALPDDDLVDVLDHNEE